MPNQYNSIQRAYEYCDCMKILINEKIFDYEKYCIINGYCEFINKTMKKKEMSEILQYAMNELRDLLRLYCKHMINLDYTNYCINIVIDYFMCIEYFDCSSYKEICDYLIFSKKKVSFKKSMNSKTKRSISELDGRVKILHEKYHSLIKNRFYLEQNEQEDEYWKCLLS